MTIKKKYTPPKVTEVQLVVKEAVLGTCHSSPITTSINATPFGCVIIPAYDPCYDGPGFDGPTP